ncbi:hypothetical protein GQX73_g214 [Xylaria multiplex]|uniref:Uncharacterized protein n=1 Tax=Xylaria multiplex TaxID=323545 RepID=A0A7C8IXZ7_9PEZI|nr:hypothetical protein GQX73_g214 [Xylaria multiplex]
MDEHRSQEDKQSTNQSSTGSGHMPDELPPVIEVDQGSQLHSSRVLPSPQPSMASSQSQASTPTNPGTQASDPNNTAAGPAPAPGTTPPVTSTVPIPPQQPAFSGPPGINPAVPPSHQAHPGAAYPPQHPARPPTVPWGYPPYQYPNPNLGGPFNMATPNLCPQQLCYPPPHMQQQSQQQQIWYYYPGVTPATGLPSKFATSYRLSRIVFSSVVFLISSLHWVTCTPKSPWWSGTAHYHSNPPPQAPQVYTVEPAYIMPQATYYQAATPAAGPFCYYVPGAPTYYYC